MEPTGALGNLGASASRLLVNAGAALITVVLGWHLLKVILSGGNDRQVRAFVISALLMAIAVAALSNLSQTAALATSIGSALWSAIADAVRQAA